MSNAAPELPRPTETTAVLAPGLDATEQPLPGALGVLEARIRALALASPRQEDLLTDARILGVELEKTCPDPERVAELGRELLQADGGLLWPFVAALLQGRAVDGAVRREFQEAPTRRLPPEPPKPRATTGRLKQTGKQPKTTARATPPRTTTKKKKTATRKRAK